MEIKTGTVAFCTERNRDFCIGYSAAGRTTIYNISIPKDKMQSDTSALFNEAMSGKQIKVGLADTNIVQRVEIAGQLVLQR